VAQPLPPPAETVFPGYFETQEEMRCGKHAVNNAMGMELLTNELISQACDIFLLEYTLLHGVPTRREDNEKDHGWYSSEVLAQALSDHNLELLLNPLCNAPEIFSEDRVFGAIVNIDNAHWVALKRVDGDIWLLDSTAAPEILSEEEFLQLINFHRSAYCVCAARDDAEAAGPPP